MVRNTQDENGPVPPGEAGMRLGQHRADTADVQEHARSLPQWALQYEQLSQGVFQGRVEHIALPGAYMVRETMNRSVRQRGEIGRHMYGFAMVLEPDGQAICNGQRFGACALLVGRGNDLDLCNSGASQIGAFSVDCDVVEELSQRIFDRPVAPWLDQQLAVAVDPAVAQALRAQLHQAFAVARAEDQTAASTPQGMARMRDETLLAFLDSLPLQADTSHLKSIALRRRIVHRAREMIMQRPDDPPSLPDICRHVGASLRKLNYCFQDIVGMSPARYLRVLRLNAVRSQLRAGHRQCGGVHDAAARWGFWHLGLFAADYRRQFGELPSRTLALRQAAGTAGG